VARLFRWVCLPQVFQKCEVFSLLLLRFSYSPHWQSLPR
jgi:hypothetical protein